MWLRNMQLSILGSLIAMIPFAFGDESVKDIEGFDLVVLAIVLLQALGGLAVSASLIYTDSVLKGFATSISLLVVGFFDSFVLQEYFGPAFWFGSFVVVSSVWAYSNSTDFVGLMLEKKFALVLTV
mmetsp:Transcript_17728/g.36931  ORF Transcript_17728/g.36931 Transcript_17728/m.36931 type:complete len:126 (-) Transcript_17728:1285-1662(-)